LLVGGDQGESICHNVPYVFVSLNGSRIREIGVGAQEEKTECGEGGINKARTVSTGF